MAQLGKDIFAAGGALMAVEEAVTLLFERVLKVEGTETVALLDADGRVLAEPLFAPVDLPPFDNSAEDGYAVRFEDLAKEGATLLPVSARVAAGHICSALPGANAVRIFTGAPVPEGMD